ncbi:MAG: 2,3-bisphosphoglycerate-independent phosphoglycerate mutase [bacterium]|nr:2,3-bisphosphoglycerate-independent phosphoglycerate mutase [bacterium]
MTANKGLMIVLDGLGDRPQEALAGQTPLEAARTPCFDRLADAGQCGLVDPVSPGVPVDTHTGCGILAGLPMGLAMELERGPVEAAGVGMTVHPGQVALRCNFATLEPAGRKWRIVDRRAGRIRVGTEELAEGLARVNLGGGVHAKFRPATQHRGVLVLSGSGLSANVSDTDPGSAHDPCLVRVCRSLCPSDREAVRTAEAIDRFLDKACEHLSSHPINLARIERGERPANGLITRGAGMHRGAESIITRQGLSAAVVAAERSVLGLAALFGFEAQTDARFTALPDTDLHAKAAAAMAALQTHDFVLLHVKAPDICSHDQDPIGKRDVIEQIDAAFAPILQPGSVAIAVGADHSTDSSRGDHCGDPVPTILYEPAGRRDMVTSYGERDCSTGGLGRIRGDEFVRCLLSAMNAITTFRPSVRERLGL